MYACIPGDWYIITDVSNPEDFDHVVHSTNLKIINKNRFPTPDDSKKNDIGSHEDGLRQEDNAGVESKVKAKATVTSQSTEQVDTPTGIS